jgi:hypothetical protein
MVADLCLGPIIFVDTLSINDYTYDILYLFSGKLTQDKFGCSYLQQDGATAHMLNAIINILRESFQDRVISTSLWPP